MLKLKGIGKERGKAHPPKATHQRHTHAHTSLHMYTHNLVAVQQNIAWVVIASKDKIVW